MNAKNQKESIHLVQITDTHLYGVREGTLLKLNTHDSLSMVLETVQRNEKHIDMILATGDIAQDASESAYNYFKEYIAPLKAPFRWIPGNHDVAEIMRQMSGDTKACEKLEQINNWLIILLDSSRIGHVHGVLNKSELEFLKSNLDHARADKTIDHVMVCLHHNPIPGSAGWMKDIGLRNDQEFLNLVSNYDCVRCVVYGHIHQELDFMFNHIRLFCTPSTCIQFKPEVIDFALDNVNPGYRRFDLFPDGSIESNVVRVAGQKFEADFSSAGY